MRYDGHGIHFRQSDISSYVTCPEQFRWEADAILNGGVPIRSESDAALAGTSLHAVIEAELTGAESFEHLDDAVGYAIDFYQTQVASFDAEGVPFVMGTFRTYEKGLLAAAELVGEWWISKPRDIYMFTEGHRNLVCEWDFDVPFAVHPNGLPIYLSGTSDMIVEDDRVVDWKSSGRSYKRWEKQRWAVQPTVYTYAAQYEGLVTPKNGVVEFDYWVFLRDGGGHEKVTVSRGPGQWLWLEQRVIQMVDMLEAKLDRWPMNDSHALCSPKWCPVWDLCKGQHVDANNWS